MPTRLERFQAAGFVLTAAWHLMFGSFVTVYLDSGWWPLLPAIHRRPSVAFALALALVAAGMAAVTAWMSTKITHSLRVVEPEARPLLVMGQRAVLGISILAAIEALFVLTTLSPGLYNATRYVLLSAAAVAVGTTATFAIPSSA
jgi:hypothetical protein